MTNNTSIKSYTFLSIIFYILSIDNTFANELITPSTCNKISYYDQAEALVQANEIDKALAVYDEAHQKIADDPQILWKKGDLLQSLKRYEEALVIYSENIKKFPNYSWSYINSGDIYRIKQDYDKALEYYDKALKIDPKDSYIYNNKGYLYDQIGKIDLAVNNYNKAIEIDPSSWITYNNMGRMFSRLGKDKEALEVYNKAISLNTTDNVYIYYSAGTINFKLGHYDNAIVMFKKVIAIDPKSFQSYFYCSLAYSKLKDYEQALKYLDKSLSIKPDNGKDDYEFYYSAGITYLKSNRDIDAINMFNKAIEINSDNFQPYFYCSLAYVKIKDYKQALKYLDKGLSIEPNDEKMNILKESMIRDKIVN